MGAVLVGEETYIGTRGSIEYRPAQPVVAKGKEAPVQAWLALRATAAIGERPSAQVPMIGRDRELGVLTGVWKRVIDEGRSHFVTVFGPAGIGKSRIALELSQLVAGQGARVIRGRSTPYGASSPYSAFGQQVKQTARIFDSDDAAEASEKLAEAIASLAGPAAAEEHAPNLAMLLGLDDEGEAADREQLFFSARVLVESLAMRSPTLLLYEDIHWADASLLDLLETFGARVRDVPVLFLALARPELLGERPGWGGGLPAYTALPLEPLGDAAGRELATELLGRVDTTMRAERVAETAEGNPLFIEELARCIGEQQATGTRRAADEHPRNHRRQARRAAVRGACRSRRRLGGRPGVLARRVVRDRGARGSVAGTRLTRGTRPHPARGGVPDPRRPAVRLQARAHPRRRLRDASARGPPRKARRGRAVPGGHD